MHASHLTRRPRAAASAAALTLALTSALAGCSGEEQAAADGSSPAGAEASASADPAESGSEPSTSDAASSEADAGPVATIRDEVEEPELPEGLKNRPKDRAEFSRYVVDAWIYAFITNDPDPLIDNAVKGGCDGCGNLRKEMRTRADEGYFVELTGVGVGETNEPKKQPPDGRVTITRTSLALPESRILNDDGSLRALSPAHPDTTFTAKIKWLPPKQTKAKGKKNSTTPGELRLVSFGVETKD